MRILFIVPYPTEGPSNRFRVEQYLPYLKENGITYSIRPFCNTNFYRILLKKGHYIKKFFYLAIFAVRRVADLFRLPAYDVVFIHREAFPMKDYIFEWLFRLFAKKIIYDFDDSVFLKKPAKIRLIVSKSDIVLAGNRFLRDYAFRFNEKVLLLPTCIDTDKYSPAVKPAERNKIVIGWIGTPSTSIYLYELKDVFRFISGKYSNVEFRIIGAEIAKDTGLPPVNRGWSLEREVEDLREFDIGIMPMPDNDWTRGKCAFKIIQYMAVGVPAVASPVGMNTEVLRHGINGYLASTHEEWCQALSVLVESRDLRKRLGDNARKTVEEKYSLKVNAPKFIDALKVCDRA